MGMQHSCEWTLQVVGRWVRACGGWWQNVVMRRLATTVLAVVGEDAAACVSWFSTAVNVATVEIEPEEDDVLVQARAVWAETVRSRSRFTMHAADPLQEVGDAWVGEFGGAPRGRLEVAAAAAVASWRADSIGLPDYYLVLDPDSLPDAHKHWYLGVLHQAAPHRVVPVAPEAADVAAAIGRLASGRWWPDLPEIMDGLATALPDSVMIRSVVAESESSVEAGAPLA